MEMLQAVYHARKMVVGNVKNVIKVMDCMVWNVCVNVSVQMALVQRVNRAQLMVFHNVALATMAFSYLVIKRV